MERRRIAILRSQEVSRPWFPWLISHATAPADTVGAIIVAYGPPKQASNRTAWPAPKVSARGNPPCLTQGTDGPVHFRDGGINGASVDHGVDLLLDTFIRFRWYLRPMKLWFRLRRGICRDVYVHGGLVFDPSAKSPFFTVGCSFRYNVCRTTFGTGSLCHETILT